MKGIRKLILFMMVALLVPAMALAEIKEKTDFGGGVSEVSYYASEEAKKEGTILRTEYYTGDALQASKHFITLDDGTLRTETRNAAGEVDTYTLYKVEDGKEMLREFDKNDRLLSSSMFSGSNTTNTLNQYDEQGQLLSSRVVTSFGNGVVRFEEFDAAGQMKGYSLEASGRRDNYAPDGKLLDFVLYQAGEDGTHTERHFDSRGELQAYTVRSTAEDGSARTETFNAADQLQGYTITRMAENGVVTERYDAAGSLMESVTNDKPDMH